jgi:lathosterol oxidase
MPTESYSAVRIIVGYWSIIYLGALMLYFGLSGSDYLWVFVINGKKNFPNGDGVPKGQNWKDISLSVKSMILESLMVSFFYLGIERGYSKMYYDINYEGRGWPFILGTTLLFLVLADAAIYWIHWGLHQGILYRYIHKPHHGSKIITPWTSHAFHPVDGFCQGLPYYLFVYLLPMHHIQHTVLLLCVNIWTISIHDRVVVCEKFGINGAGYHDVHHQGFVYNYGQYFTFWDRLMGTYKSQEMWFSQKGKRPECQEEEVQRIKAVKPKKQE